MTKLAQRYPAVKYSKGNSGDQTFEMCYLISFPKTEIRVLKSSKKYLLWTFLTDDTPFRIYLNIYKIRRVFLQLKKLLKIPFKFQIFFWDSNDNQPEQFDAESHSKQISSIVFFHKNEFSRRKTRKNENKHFFERNFSEFFNKRTHFLAKRSEGKFFDIRFSIEMLR